jgi:esterase/lipase
MKNIILIHGAIGAKDQLEFLANALKQEGCNVFVLNFSGHGHSAFQDKFGIEQFALELEQFININHLIAPTIFGYSMGGYVALYLAYCKPTLLGSIITLGTKFEWSPEISQKEIKMLNVQTILEKVPKFAETLKLRHGQNWELLLQKTVEMMLNMGLKNTMSLSDFKTIQNKVFIGLADKDTMVGLNETISVYKQLSNGAMYMLPDSKHPIETVNIHLLSKIIAGC